MAEKKHGGARPNSGRIKKDELVTLIESMDAICVPNTVWESLAKKVKEGSDQAIKTWLAYRYGMPKQTIDQKTEHTINDFDITKIYGGKA